MPAQRTIAVSGAVVGAIATTVCVIVCVLAYAGRAVADEGRAADDELTQKSRAWFEAGRAAYRAGDYARAVESFEKGYELKPLPLYLFNIGKAASKAGLKRKALQFFRQYVAREPASVEADEARQRVRELERELGEPAVQAAAAGAVTAPGAAAPPVAATAPSATLPLATTTGTDAAIARRVPRRWSRDAAGWSLVAAGAAVAAVGGGVWGWANADARAANGATTLQAYDDARAGVVPRQTAGIALVAAGGALVLGGVVRFAVVGRRR